MKKLIGFTLSLLLSLNIFTQEANTALLLIDIQEFYFPGGFSELVNPGGAAQNAAKILKHFRESGQTVIHIQHKTEKQMEINHLVAPIEGEASFIKTEINSFKGTDLKNYLDSISIKNLVIVGMQTHMCIEAATRAASDYNYTVVLIEDACATRNLEWDGQLIKAQDVHYSTLNTLKNYASILSTQDYLKEDN